MVLRRLIIRVSVIIIVAGVAFAAYIGYRLLSIRYWEEHWSEVPPGSADFRLEQAATEPGGKLVLVGEFHRAYDFGFPTLTDPVHIFSGNGGVDDLFLNPDELLSANSSPTTGFTFPRWHPYGCAVSLGPPQGPPSRKYIDRQEIIVLPDTPSGDYVLRLNPGAYCNGLPEQAVNLRFEVGGL